MERSTQGFQWNLVDFAHGRAWQDLPPRYGAYQIGHRRFQSWRKQGVIETACVWRR